jgi:hypothetical protein
MNSWPDIEKPAEAGYTALCRAFEPASAGFRYQTPDSSGGPNQHGTINALMATRGAMNEFMA